MRVLKKTNILICVVLTLMLLFGIFGALPISKTANAYSVEDIYFNNGAWWGAINNDIVQGTAPTESWINKVTNYNATAYSAEVDGETTQLVDLDTNAANIKFEISTAEQLALFNYFIGIGESLNGITNVTVNIVENIDMSEYKWTPIDFNFNLKIFVFNGCGKHISGIYVSEEESASDTIGFFGRLKDATIKNLNIDKSFVSGANDVGGIVGIIHHTETNQITLLNCTFDGIVVGRDNVGGICGTNEKNNVIENCESKGYIFGAFTIGGVVGFNARGKIFGCSSSAVINMDYNDSSTGNLGGVVGLSTGTVFNCWFKGSIKCVAQNPSNEVVIGGIVGENITYVDEDDHNQNQAGVIANCYNTGNICVEFDAVENHEENVWIGGIFGDNFMRIASETNSLDCLVFNCYSTATIEIINGSILQAGDIGGKCWNTAAKSVFNCYYLEHDLNVDKLFYHVPDLYPNPEKGCGKFNANGSLTYVETEGNTETSIINNETNILDALNYFVDNRQALMPTFSEDELIHITSWVNDNETVNDGFPMLLLQTSTNSTQSNTITAANGAEGNDHTKSTLIIVLSIVVVLIVGAAIFLTTAPKKITFILNGQKVAQIKVRFREDIILPRILALYKWFEDEKQTKLFVRKKMRIFSLTLYRNNNKKIKK